MCAKVYINT